MVVGSSHFPVDYPIRQTTEKYVLTSSSPKKGFKSETFLGGSGRPNFMNPCQILSDSPLHPNVSFTLNLLLTLSKSSFNIPFNFVSFGQYFCIPKLIEL